MRSSSGGVLSPPWKALFLVGFLVLVALSAAAAAGVRRTVHRAASDPRGWRLLSAAEEEQVPRRSQEGPAVSGYVALKEKPEGLAHVQASLEASSDPNHPRYGRHMGLDEMTSLVAPDEADVQRVAEWLRAAGAAHVQVAEPSRSWIRFAFADKVAAEALLGCRLGTYVPETAATKAAVIQRCVEGAYEVPTELDNAIDFVAPFVGKTDAYSFLKRFILKKGKIVVN